MDDLLFLTDTIDSVEMNTSYAPLPAGMYAMNIVGAETKPTKAGTGKYLELVLEVASGPHTGRKLWDRLNVQNPNPQAQEIAQRALKTIKVMCGIGELRSSTQFLGHQIPVKVELKPRKDDANTLENSVRYEPTASNGNAAAPRPATPMAAQAAQAAQAGAPAWRTRQTALA